MLTLYHAGGSVCSAKVRIGLAEKGLEWNSHPISLPKGEHTSPDYVKLNPNGVVPTLVDRDLVVVESSVILEYLDALSPDNPLMPVDLAQATIARIWLVRCIDIHAAINTMTFSTVNRLNILATQSAAEIEATIQNMTNPANGIKRRDLMANGIDSPHVWAALFTLRRMFDDMQFALETSDWLLGDDYAIADTALLSYVDRLDRLGFAGLWNQRTPNVARWFAMSKGRPSYSAISDYADTETAAKMREEGAKLWPVIEEKWNAFLASGSGAR